MTLLFLEDEEVNERTKLEEMLGILWNRQDVENMFSPDSKTDDTAKSQRRRKLSKVRYPLALALNPDLVGQLGRQFGLVTDTKADKPEELSENLSKEEFLNKLGFAPKAGNLPTDGITNTRNSDVGLRPRPPGSGIR